MVLLPSPATRSLRLAALVVTVAAASITVSPTASTPIVSPAEGAAADWVWPLDQPRTLVRPFIAPPTPYAAGHRGIDIASVGDDDSVTVYAPADGVVHFAGVVVDRPVLSINHGNGVLSSFEPVASTLVAGIRVRQGEVIGVLQPGHCLRPCLHLGARRDGAYVSPLNFLGGIPHSVLLPTRPLGADQARGWAER